MSTIEYLFNNKSDFDFYVLNAVAHDFIHDFNNYSRMSSILEYIMSLKPQTGQIGGNDRFEDIEIEDTPIEDIPIDEYDIFNNTQNSIDNMDITKNISTEEMYDSQIEQHYSGEIGKLIISDLDDGLRMVGEITNKNIEFYNSIQRSIANRRVTRSVTNSIYKLQLLRDLIQESIFLIISKLQPRNDRIPTTIQAISIGGKKQKKNIKIKQIGGSGINIIGKTDIIDSINDIIRDISETKSEIDLNNLINVFKYIMYSFSNLSIPNISPLEILNNSLIENNVCIFILGKCNPDNIEGQAKLSLRSLLSSSSDKYSGILDKSFKIDLDLKKQLSSNKIQPDVYLNPAIESKVPYINRYAIPKLIYGGASNINLNDAEIDSFKSLIDNFKLTNFYQAYKTNFNSDKIGEYYRECSDFITSNKLIVEKIVGTRLLNVKIKEIDRTYQNITSASQGVRRSSRSRNLDNFQIMYDVMKDLVITQAIEKFEDFVNKKNARVIADSDVSSGYLPPIARSSVQKISQLLAIKVLELTNASPIGQITDRDLQTQINILTQVSRDTNFTVVDDILIDYFIDAYKVNPNIRVGNDANRELTLRLGSCRKQNCRAINNAVHKTIKDKITNIFVCPTSSICDGMGSFGNCVPPKNIEFANMDFIISYDGADGESYYGQTNIKPNKKSVNINYGYNLGDLILYNSLDIMIDSKPIVLEANYVFKNLINQIISIWKSQDTVRDINELWESLKRTDYFISVLKLGSQKSIGDIFQEINSTLYNAGYNQSVQKLIEKKTFGLMGDRPSGVRVIKLLKDARSGKNPNASGGYTGTPNSQNEYPKAIIYFSPPPQPQRIRGGSKSTRKIKHKMRKTKFRVKTRVKNKRSRKIKRRYIKIK